MYPLTLGLAIETRDLWDEVQACIQDLPVRTVIEHQDLGDLAPFMDRLERMRPDVVLLDIGKLRDSLEGLVAQIRSHSPDSMIVALHTSADPEVILSAVRAGASEYLYPPLHGNLTKALERKSGDRGRKRDGVRAGGKTAGFFSAKGGCGATTVACHLAVELGRQNQKVLLVDLDLEAGLIGFLMKTKSPYSFLDAINNLHRLDLSYWKALVSNGIPGVEIMPAPLALASKQGIKQEQLRHVFGFVRSHYDWTLVDLGRSLSHLSMGALEEIDEGYLVTTLEVPALHQAKQVVQVLLDSGYGKNRLHLVLNRVPKRVDITPSELEKMLGLPIHSMLPDDYPELYESYSEGKLLSRNTDLAKHIARLSVKLTGIQETKTKRKFSFFG
jgi:pilus assembly protein CpaE